MNGEKRLIHFTDVSYPKIITNIQDKVFHFLGYGHSNAIAVIGDTSVILIDTLDSDVRAKYMYEEIQKITDKPVKTIIYTHGHPDHRGGAGYFQDTVEEIIAFTPVQLPPRYYERINPFLNRRGMKQHGYGLSHDEAISQGIGIREGKEVNEGQYHFLSPTTLYDKNEVKRNIDGIEFEFSRAVGECEDGILVYLPKYKVICTGDNYCGCFPNLYAIRGTPYRDVATWIDTLNHILSYQCDYLLPGHSRALVSSQEVQEIITNYRDAIESILMQTLECMSKSLTLDETVQSVRLDDKYQKLEYLGEYYGTVEWSVKSIYNGYIGWFDGNPSQLLPVSEKAYAQMLIDLIDDENKIIDKIYILMKHEEYQMGLQLVDLLLSVKETPDLICLKKELLMKRAKQMTSANARHYLIASAKEL